MNTSVTRLARVLVRSLLAFSLVISLSAFRHTDVEGYTDPDFQGYTFRTVVIQMPNASLDFRLQVEKRMTKLLRKKGIRVLLHNDLFPPTRDWDQQSSAAIYERNDVDAGIVITVGSRGSETTPGMVMYNATTVGGTTTGYATQMSVARDHAAFEIAIVDAESMRTVWKGDLATRGAGLLFVGSKSTAKGLVKGLLREWKSAGHVR